jgi:hypothetical protein
MAWPSVGSLDVLMGDFVIALTSHITVDTCPRGAHGGHDQLFRNWRVESVFF